MLLTLLDQIKLLFSVTNDENRSEQMFYLDIHLVGLKAFNHVVNILFMINRQRVYSAAIKRNELFRTQMFDN